MFGFANCTIRGLWGKPRVDTLRLLVQLAAPKGTEERVAMADRLADYGLLFLPKHGRVYVEVPGEEALQGSARFTKGGLAFEFGAEALRAASCHAIGTLKFAIDKLAARFRVTVPRADFSVQLPWLPLPDAESESVFLERTRTHKVHEWALQNMSLGLKLTENLFGTGQRPGTLPGRTVVFHWKAQKRLDEGRCVKDELRSIVYEAYDTEGERYCRYEVAERYGSRAWEGFSLSGMSASLPTLRILGAAAGWEAESAQTDVVRAASQTMDDDALLKRAYSLLASRVPARHMQALVGLMGELKVEPSERCLEVLRQRGYAVETETILISVVGQPDETENVVMPLFALDSGKGDA